MKTHMLSSIASTMISLGLCAAPMPTQTYGSYTNRSYCRQSVVSSQTFNKKIDPQHCGKSSQRSRSASPHNQALLCSNLKSTHSNTKSILELKKSQASFIEPTPPSCQTLSLVKNQPVSELVIIDHNVPDKHILYRGLKPGVDVVEFNGYENGLIQLQNTLSQYRDLDTLHIVSHGEEGVIFLGSSQLDEKSLKGKLQTLASIDKAMKDQADVLIYGCEVAKSEKGEALLQLISNKANVDIAASNNLFSGNTAKGDWQLEIKQGNIESELAFSEAALRQFDDVLAIDDGTGRTINTTGFSAGYATTKSYDVDSSGYVFRIATNSANGNSLYSGFGYVAANLSGAIGGLSSVTVDFSGGQTFDIDSLEMQSTTTRNYVFTPSSGSPVTLSVSNASFNTQTLNFSNITSFTITRQDSGDLEPAYMDNFVIKNAAPALDSDGNLTAAGTVTEPVAIPTNVDTVGEAVDVFDFTLTDGGSADGLAMAVSQIVVNVTGTASDTQRDSVTWRLNGPDASNVAGVYNSGSDTITFSGLSISIADGGNEDYTINAYYNDNTNLTEGLTYILSVDGDTDLTVGGSGTQMGATSAVNNGSGSTVDITATALVFTTQPATSVSGSALGTQPVVTAQDAFGNTDTDFTEIITVTEASLGSLTNGSVAASSGVATFVNLTYTATADQQSFTLTANDQDGVGSDLPTVDANAVTSDVVATQLVFDTQPAPLSVNSGVATNFTTVPVVSAQDGNNVVDTGYSTGITLAEVNGAGSATMSATGDTDGSGATVTITPSSGVSTFTNMQITYTASGGMSENFNLEASSGGLTSVDSSQLTGLVDSTPPTITDANISISGASGTGGAYIVGDTVTATWNNTAGGDNNNDVASVTVDFSQFGGGAAVAASNSSDTWTATFTLTEDGGGSIDATNRNVSVTATDTSSNADTTADTSNATVDNDSPVVTDGNISISGASGTGGAFIVGDTVTATWNNTAGGDNNSDTISSVTVDFSQFGGGGAVVASNSSDTWTATFTLTEDGGGSIDASNRNVSVTATDNAGNSTTAADTTNATVDNDSPVVSDGNLSISGASGSGGAYIVGDTVTATWNNTAGGDNNGDTISIVIVDFSAFGGGAAVSASNSSETWTATYTITAGAVDVTNLNVSATATDNAGNATTTADTTNATVDNQAPTVSDANISISGASGTGGAYIVGDTITVTWNDTAGGDNNGDISSVTVDFSAFGGAAVSASNSSETWTATYTITAGAVDVTNLNVSATATDNAGNATTTADTTNATVDNQAPTVSDANISISGASGTGGAYIVGDTITVTWNDTAGGDNNGDISSVTVDFSEFGGGAAVSASNSSDTWTATFTLTEDGGGSIDATNRNVSVTATDNAGNSTTAADTTNATVDNDSPVVSDGNLSISGASGSGGAYIVGDTVTATWNNTAGGDNNGDTISTVTVDFSQFGGGAAVSASNSSETWTASFTLTEDGGGSIDASNRNVSVTATDNASNSTTTADSSNATVDNDSPVVSESTAVTTPSNDTTPDVTIASTQAGTLAVGGSCGSGDEGAIAAGSTTITLTQTDNSSALADGSYSDCSVSVVDDAGNSSNVLTLTAFTIDATAPAAPSTPDMDAGSDSGSSNSDNITSDTTPTFTGTAEANGTVNLNSSVDGAVGSSTADGSGNWSITASTLSSGAHNITASASDAVGNSGSASSALAITIDFSAPSAPSTPDLTAASDSGSSDTDNNTSNTTPAFTGTAEASSTITLSSSVDGTVGSATSDGSGNWSITASTLATGSHNITATATDVAGNAGSASAALSITIANPTVSAVSIPNSAMIVGDAVPVTITANAAGFSLVSGTINGVAVTGFSDDGGGNYSATYTVAEGNTDRAAGDSIPVSFLLQDGAGNDTNTFTTAIAQNADPIDANSPGAATGTLAVDENAVDSTSVGTVSSTDTDSYALVDDASGRFDMETGSGEVTVEDGSLLNFENDSSHTITVRATDASGNTTDTALTVTINNVNDLPVAGNDSASTNEDNAVLVDVLANDIDEDGSLNPASVSVASGPSNGSTSINTANGVITYTPTADFEGADSFTYTVFDNETGQSNAATVSLTVNAQNDAPVAADDLANTTEDNAVVIDAAANDSDIDTGDSVNSATLAIVTLPSDGNVVINSGQFTYTPDSDFFGTDTFTYTIQDQNAANSNTATVTVNVSGINDSPTAVDDSVATDEDTEVTIDVLSNDSDIDGTVDATTLVVVAQPSQGSVRVESGQLIYTPDSNINGADSLTYSVRDDSDASSNEATVDITINAVNDNPVANDDTANLLEDGTLMINVLGNDSDAESGFVATNVTLTIAQAPANGSVEIESNGMITYTPDAFYNGADSFRYTVTDLDGGVSNEALVSITVESVNNAPLTNNDSASTNEDTAVVIEPLSNDSDVDGTLDLSQLVIVVQPTLGALVDNGDGSLTYTPDANANGSDSFTYTIADDLGAVSAAATVNLTIAAVNDAPEISGTPADGLIVGQSYSFMPSVSDVDNTSFSFSADNLPSWLALDTDSGALSGTASADNIGSYDNITLTVSDGLSSASLAPFSIEVGPDTDGDGTPDGIDDDDDGDGMPDSFENANGFDPLDPLDASGDADGDGLSNVEEFEQESNPTVDDQPPVFEVVTDADINATGLLTVLPNSLAPTAVDGLDGEVPVTLLDSRTAFLSGRHVLRWGASDAAGNSSEITQTVDIHPQISFAKDKEALRGTESSIRIVLNGESPEYPLTINYSVSGTAQFGIDHTLVNGSITIASGTDGQQSFDVLTDSTGSGGSTLIASLDGENLNVGENPSQTITFVEDNRAPALSFSVQQDGLETSIVGRDSGLVDISLTIDDLNTGDSNQVVWDSAPVLNLQAVDDTNRQFDPSSVPEGIYSVSVNVTDDGEPAETSSLVLTLKVIAEIPTLGSEDSDSDGTDDDIEGYGDSDGDKIPDFVDAISSTNVLQHNVDVNDSFLVEAEPGIQLSLGLWSLATTELGAWLSEEEMDSLSAQSLIEADSVENIGGYIDFVASGLSNPGQSIRIVLPQRRAIPTYAVYRKYLPMSGWMDFVEDANNYLESAQGSGGICPPPGSNDYQAGLNQGHWCVQMTIEDGGPNDADAEANATISDPGGVSRLGSASVRSSGGGGIGWPILMVCLMLLALRYRRALKGGLPMVLVALTLSAPAPKSWAQQTSDKGCKFFLELSIYQVDGSESSGAFTRGMSSDGFEVDVSSYDQSRQAFQLAVGFPNTGAA